MQHRMSTGRTLWLGAIAVSHLAWVGGVLADQVHLADGSLLMGTVRRLEENRLTVETDFSGTLTIEASKVAGITSTRRLHVQLKTGERVAGELFYAPNSPQVVKGSAFGDLAVSLADVTAIWESDATPPDHGARAAEAARKQEQQMEQLKEEHRKELEVLHGRIEAEAAKWTAQLEMGLNGQTGTTETTAFNGRGELRRTTQKERLLAYIQGRYSQQDNVRSINEILGGIELEVDMNERWFAFGRIGLEFDEFEELDLRSTASSGVGYFFIREPDHELKARAGAGYQHESFMDGTTEDEGIVEAGVEYMKQIAPWLLFKHSTTYHPTLSDPASDYRIVAETSGTIPLEGDKGWKIKLGMRNEFDSLPRPDVERLDTFYTINLVYELLK